MEACFSAVKSLLHQFVSNEENQEISHSSFGKYITHNATGPPTVVFGKFGTCLEGSPQIGKSDLRSAKTCKNSRETRCPPTYPIPITI